MKVWIQITSGRGPEECARAVFEVSKEFTQEAKAKRYTVELLDSAPSKNRNCYKSVLLSLEGEDLDAFLVSWEGPIQWIMKSPFRPNHGRRNWFVGLSVLKPIETHCGFCESDIAFEATRASGPGGQHVNKTSTAIRATYRPSGISVFAQEERSQMLNKKLAIARINKAISANASGKLREAEKKAWGEHNNLERGNPIRVYTESCMRRTR